MRAVYKRQALYIYLFSDAPFVQHNTVYQIIRCGRVKWGIIQLENIFLSSCCFNIISFILSVVILTPHVSFEDGWGKVIYTLSRTDAGTSYNISINFPYDVVGKYTPLQVLKLTMLILWLAGSCIGLLMFALSLWWGRVAALIGASKMCIRDRLGVTNAVASFFANAIANKAVAYGYIYSKYTYCHMYKKIDSSYQWYMRYWDMYFTSDYSGNPLETYSQKVMAGN